MSPSRTTTPRTRPVVSALQAARAPAPAPSRSGAGVARPPGLTSTLRPACRSDPRKSYGVFYGVLRPGSGWRWGHPGCSEGELTSGVLAETVARRQRGGLAPGVDAKLGIDVGDVFLDRPPTEE